MKKVIRLSVIAVLFVAMLFGGNVPSYAADASVSYSPDKALSYANKHYMDKKAYDGKSQDCVKFVRKCVEAGGVPAEKGRSV